MSNKPRQTDPLHESLLLLDRLEELREDMEDLGVNSLEEVRQRIAALEAQLDDDSADGSDDGPV